MKHNEQTKIKNEAVPTLSKRVVLFWAEPNILSIGNPVQGAGSLARLLPGINLIDRRVWTRMQADSILSMNIDAGSLKLVTENGDFNWDELDQNTSENYISKISDIILLEDIEASSTKSYVTRAAKTRIKKIMSHITPKED